MSAVTVRNLSEETHRALRVRAARRGRSTEAEIRDILDQAVRPQGRVRLGALLAGIGREAGATDKDVDAVQQVRDASPAAPTAFD